MKQTYDLAFDFGAGPWISGGAVLPKLRGERREPAILKEVMVEKEKLGRRTQKRALYSIYASRRQKASSLSHQSKCEAIAKVNDRCSEEGIG